VAPLLGDFDEPHMDEEPYGKALPTKMAIAVLFVGVAESLGFRAETNAAVFDVRDPKGADLGGDQGLRIRVHVGGSVDEGKSRRTTCLAARL
jgi:hypothetical protein